MDAITALLTRNSAARLVEPAPAGAAREHIFRAALRAPDHARLQPWHFLVVEGEGRNALGAAMARALQRHAPDSGAEALDKLRVNPLRAPLVLVLVARLSEHPKVPALEQQLATACAAQNMLLAAHALGFGGIWRTGQVTYTAELREELGLPHSDRVIGFLYLGTPEGTPKPLPAVDPAAHFHRWPH
jgi:nitroreductase